MFIAVVTGKIISVQASGSFSYRRLNLLIFNIVVGLYHARSPKLSKFRVQSAPIPYVLFFNLYIHQQ
jgi:hypothetical protein